MRKWGNPVLLEKKPGNWEFEQLIEFFYEDAARSGLKRPVVVFEDDFLKAFGWSEMPKGVYACGWYADE